MSAATPAFITDTSVIMAVLMREPEAEFVARVLVDHRIVAPRSVDFEIGNALVNTYKRKRISESALIEAITAFGKLDIARVDVDLQVAVQIAAKYGIYAYDAYMIQCAASHGLALLTLDQGLDSAARAHGVAVVEVFK